MTTKPRDVLSASKQFSKSKLAALRMLIRNLPAARLSISSLESITVDCVEEWSASCHPTLLLILAKLAS